VPIFANPATLPRVLMPGQQNTATLDNITTSTPSLTGLSAHFSSIKDTLVQDILSHSTGTEF